MTTQPDNHHEHLAAGSCVLVTGGTGFLGAYIIRDLVKQHYRVRAIRRSAKTPSFIDPAIWNATEWIDCDVLDPLGLEAAMTTADAVVHSAAVVSFHASDREAMYKTNIEGTANVVNAALTAGVKRFVHISSVAALGRRNDGNIVSEKQLWEESRNNTHYAISKHQGEMEVWRGIAEGLPAVILNPSTIVGYGDWNSSSCAIFRHVHERFPWYTNGVNGFVDVEDVSRAALLMLQSSIGGERFIVSAENRSYKSLLDAIADGFGIRRPDREATPLLSSLAWRGEQLRSFFTGRKPLLTRETATVARSNTRFDNSKILQALPGFDFTPLNEAIKRACDRYSSGRE